MFEVLVCDNENQVKLTYSISILQEMIFIPILILAGFYVAYAVSLAGLVISLFGVISLFIALIRIVDIKRTWDDILNEVTDNH